jgi:hypothetical protein
VTRPPATWRPPSQKIWLGVLALLGAAAGVVVLGIRCEDSRIPCDNSSGGKYGQEWYDPRPGWCPYRGRMEERVPSNLVVSRRQRDDGGYDVRIKGSIENTFDVPVLQVEAQVVADGCHVGTIALGRVEAGETRPIAQQICTAPPPAVPGLRPDSAHDTVRIQTMQLYPD